MANPRAAPYRIDVATPLPCGGGAEAFAVLGHGDLMAVRVVADAPPRPEPLARLRGLRLPGVSLPVAHVAARFADGVAPALVCGRPDGEALGQGLRPTRFWGEAELIGCVLRPVVAALAGLQAAGVPHRAIRLDNVYQSKPGAAVTLGEAWSRPPAMSQPAWCEPPQSAVCHPAGRGNGSTADDIYALGALLMLLARDEPPLEGEAANIVASKLRLGSFAALLSTARVPSAIAELARGMLADDPEHRPQPALLANPDSARGRRIPSRLARRAQRPLAFGLEQVWTARDLAHHVASDGTTAGTLLADGRLERWLRLALGEPLLATSVEAIRVALTARPQALAVAACHLVALLDPLAPLCWPGLRCWPEGIGPLLTQGPEVARALAEMAEADVVPGWAQHRSTAMSVGVAGLEWRPIRTAHLAGAGAIMRVRYDRNPLLACQGALAGQAVVLAGDLLPGLDALARLPGRAPLPLDAEAVAFAAVRCGETGGVANAAGQLGLLARVEARVRGGPTPALAAWLVAGLADQVAAWPGAEARRLLAASLQAAAAKGALNAVAALLRASGRRRANQAGADAATARIAAIDREVAAANGARHRAAGEVGRHVAIACSALFAAISLLASALG